MNTGFFQRAIAYILDAIIILICINIVSVGINTDNKYEDKLTELTTAINEQKIDIQEYYQQYQEIYYGMQKESVAVNILSIVLTLGYFIAFQFLNNGQTIGKKLLKIRLVNVNNKKLKIKQVIIRSLFIYSFLSSIINIILVNILDYKIFYTTSIIVTGIDTLFILVTIIFILYNKEKRGLHDLIAGTKVINEKEV